MDVIVGFAFGKIGDMPNLCSRKIGTFIAEYVENFTSSPVCIIAQWEVARQLAVLGIQADYILEGRYDSRTVAEIAKEYLKFTNTPHERVFVAAHPDHVRRATFCLRNAGFKNPKEMTDVSIGYDIDSDEWWVRSRWRFLMREFLATPIYALRGEL